MTRSLLALVAFVIAARGPAGADDAWGDISLRFVYDGMPPEHGRPDLVINAKDRGVANVILYLQEPIGHAKVKVHPSYDEDAKGEVKIVLGAESFHPRTVALRTTQKLQFENPELESRTVKFSTASGDFAFPILPLGKIPVALDKPDSSVPIHCPENAAKAWLIVRDNPYFALSDASGSVLIKNVPVGKQSFRVWHERAGYIRQGSIDGKAVNWPKGRIPPLEIKPGKNDLGELMMKPAILGE